MKKAEIWSLLTSVVDDQATLSAMMGEQRDTLEKIAESIKRKAAAKKARQKWDKKHIKVISTKLTAEEYSALKRRCREKGQTVYRYAKDRITAAE